MLPTILVKKSDGTTARMTLEEVRALKNTINKQQLTIDKRPLTVDPLPDEPISHYSQNSQFAHVRLVAHPEAKLLAPDWDADDHKSLLEEENTNEQLSMINSQPVKDKEQMESNNDQVSMVKPPILPTPIINNRRQDIAPPPLSAPLGPVEEIKSLSLADWRKMASSPAARAERILRTLFELGQESFLLARAAKAAWFLCPLYADYLLLLNTALNSKLTLDQAIATDPNGWTKEEIKAMVKLSRENEI